MQLPRTWLVLLATTSTLLLLLAGGGLTCALSVHLLLLLLLLLVRLDINVVLNVKFVVHVHNIYLESTALRASSSAHTASFSAWAHSLSRSCFRDIDSVSLEELLLFANNWDSSVASILLVGVGVDILAGSLWC